MQKPGKPINTAGIIPTMQEPFAELDEYLREKSLEPIPFQGTTAAWGFRENEPVLALISGNGGMAFQQAMSLYWASADYIIKPWCLLLDADIPPHQQSMLQKLSTQYNIQQVNHETILETTKNQLKILADILKVYIPEDSKPYIALGDSIRGWRNEKPVKEYTYSIKAETGNLDIYKEDGNLVSNRKTIPLTARSGSAKIDGILPRLVNTNNGLLFDTEHRNLPMVFKILLSGSSSLVARFEADKANLIEATVFWGLLDKFNASKRLAFIEPNTGDTMFNCERLLNERGSDR